MDNFSVPADTPPPDGAAIPTGPAITSLPDGDTPEALDNPPPPRPDVEDVADYAWQDEDTDEVPVLGALEDAPEASARFLTFPILGVVLAAGAGIAAGVIVAQAVHRRNLWAF